MTSRCTQLALTLLAGIILPGLIICSAISLPIALLISPKDSFKLCSSFSVETFGMQLLYESFQYMGSFSICPCVYDSIYSSSDSSCYKVHFKLDIGMYGCFGLPFLTMKSFSFSQYLTSVHNAGSWLGDVTLTLPCDTLQIAITNFEFHISGLLHPSLLATQSPKSVASRMLPLLAFLLIF